jgi:hypothetical protein
MRFFGFLIAASLALALPTTADAAERDKPRKYKSSERNYQYRSTTEARDGTCMRDNGRPVHSLNLNNRCDREEFFQRFNDYGGNRR